MNKPNYPETMLRYKQALNFIGTSEIELADHQIQAILSLEPEWIPALTLKAILFARRLQYAPAELLFKHVLQSTPDDINILANLGNLYYMWDRLDEAEEMLTRVLASNPQHLTSLVNLGLVYSKQKRFKAVEQLYANAAIACDESALVQYCLGQLKSQCGDFPKAREHYAKALQLAPHYLGAYNNLLMCQHYLPGETLESKLALARQFGAHMNTLVQPFTQWANIPDPERKLRIGFVSGDLQSHPVAYFLIPVLEALSRKGLHLTAYQTMVYNPDSEHMKLRSLIDSWRETHTLGDESFANQIRKDQIDILIDLAGHTGNNRLSVFAMKPAPVQVAWLGYFASTGLTTMDYLLADETSVPPAESSGYNEQLWYLPYSRLPLFRPPYAQNSPLPSLKPATPFTFGSFQHVDKINMQVLALWNEILTRCPDSRLRIQNRNYREDEIQQAFTERLTRAGIPLERCDLVPELALEPYLQAHGEVDLILDTFPYTGGTTTCMALWQGVPTLTLTAPGMLERQGEMFMTAAGLPEWVCHTPREYVEKAVALGNREPEALQTLASVRARYPEALARQPAADLPLFARNVEQALRDMWRRYCVSTGKQPDPA